MKTLIALILISATLAFATRAFAIDIDKDDFKTLFNNERMGQPKSTPWAGTFWPHAYHGTSANVENGDFTKNKARGTSPMQAFDQVALFRGDKSARDWEAENHTCDNVEASMKKGCKDWWGHCNGWTAAALKEEEPRKPAQAGDTQLSVADLKGILAEVWLSANTINSGETDKESTTAEGLKRGGWIDKPGDKTYEAFWDLTPRAFFLTVTNYLGVKKMGIAVDRFTGSEVWNQPLVAYRILPIDAREITQERQGGKSVWVVPMAMKIFWAADSVTPGVVSSPFNVEKDANDSKRLEKLPKGSNGEEIYESRLLEFKLFFDEEVTVSADGKKVLTAGDLVGEGIWKMQESPRSYTADQLNDGHPDFVWIPTSPILDTSGYGNPFMAKKTVSAISKAYTEGGGGTVTAGGAEGGEGTGYRITFNASAFESLTTVNATSVIRKLKRAFARGGHEVAISSKSYEESGGKIRIDAIFTGGLKKKDLESFLEDAELATVKIEAL